MGNGLPITAITGKTEFMKAFDELWVSSTNNSETLSLAGTIAVINEMQEKNTISHCWKLGTMLFEGWNKIAEKNNLNIRMTGYPVRMNMECHDSNHLDSPELRALIMQEMVKKGIFLSPSVNFLSYSHSKKDIDFTLETFDTICMDISNKISNDNYKNFIEGKMPTTVWTMKIKPTKKNNN
jgi:glutamate-1-semialdehyde 2,1-aminomutase